MRPWVYVPPNPGSLWATESVCSIVDNVLTIGCSGARVQKEMSGVKLLVSDALGEGITANAMVCRDDCAFTVLTKGIQEIIIILL